MIPASRVRVNVNALARPKALETAQRKLNHSFSRPATRTLIVFVLSHTLSVSSPASALRLSSLDHVSNRSHLSSRGPCPRGLGRPHLGRRVLGLLPPRPCRRHAAGPPARRRALCRRTFGRVHPGEQGPHRNEPAGEVSYPYSLPLDFSYKIIPSLT